MHFCCCWQNILQAVLAALPVVAILIVAFKKSTGKILRILIKCSVLKKTCAYKRMEHQ